MTSLKITGVEKGASVVVGGKDTSTASFSVGSDANVGLCATSEMFVRVMVGKTFTIIGGTISTLPNGGFEGYVLVKNDTGGGVWVHPDKMASDNIIGVEKSFVGSINNIIQFIQSIQSSEGGESEGGTLIKLIKTIDDDELTDFNSLSSLRALAEITKYALSKVNPDTAQSLIKFLSGIEIGEFSPGMFGGTGAKIDELGNIEATSLRLRALLEVPELRYNRLTVIGDEFILTENGLIESVEQLAERSYQLNMKLEDGEAIAFISGDLVKGIFNNDATSGKVATSFMRIEEVGQTFLKVTLVDDIDTPTWFNLPPQPFMNVARVGNVTDPDRQKYMVFSSKLGGFQLFDGASDFMNGTLVASFDTAQSFKSKFGNDLPTKPGLPYIYSAGIVTEDIIRVDYQGKTVREIYDRGPWQAGVTYYNNDERGTDDVWHLGCRWRCFSPSTTEEPGWTSAAWYMLEGRSDAYMDFDANIHGSLKATFMGLVINPVVFIGNTNVSADIVNEQWRWVRNSGDSAADAVWNNLRKDNGRVLNLNYTDMGTRWSKTNPVTFTCTATYPASSINQITNYVEI